MSRSVCSVTLAPPTFRGGFRYCLYPLGIEPAVLEESGKPFVRIKRRGRTIHLNDGDRFRMFHSCNAGMPVTAIVEDEDDTTS